MRLFTIIIFMLISVISRAQLTTEWEVSSLNTGKGFKDIQMLSDGSIMAQLIHCNSYRALPSNFYDAAKNAIPYDNSYMYDHELENHHTVIKFNQQGIYQWSTSYQNNDYIYADSEFDFVGYKAMKNDQIVVLLKYNEVYFKKLDIENRKKAYYDSIRLKYESGDYEEEEYYDVDYEEYEQGGIYEAQPERNRRMYALHFLNPSTGEVDSISFLPHLNACGTEIYNLQKTNNNTLVLAGRAYSRQIALKDSVFLEETNEVIGSFVATLNIETGTILWSDIISCVPQDYYYFHPSETHTYLSVSNDGTIYFSSEHTGEIKFSNNVHIYSDSINTPYTPQWVYLVSYSKDGKINWIKNNRNWSSVHTITSTDRGVYVAQYSWGKQSFDLSVDTTHQKDVCISFINKEGKELWVINLPSSSINSIQIDHNGLSIIQGVYNGISLRTTQFQINEKVRLDDKNDFFIIRLKKNGGISSVFTENLWIQDLSDSAVPTFTLTQTDEVFLSYHTHYWFTQEERKKEGVSVADTNAFADKCVLVKMKLKK